jgi:hypothetical protein
MSAAADYESSDDEMAMAIKETPIPGVDPQFRALVLTFKQGLYTAEMFKGQNDSTESQDGRILPRIIRILSTVYQALTDACPMNQIPPSFRQRAAEIKATYKANAQQNQPAYQEYLYNNFVRHPYNMNDTLSD